MIRESAILHRLGADVRRALLILALLGALPSAAQAHTLATASDAITSSVVLPVRSATSVRSGANSASS